MFDDPTQKLGRNLCFQQTVVNSGVKCNTSRR